MNAKPGGKQLKMRRDTVWQGTVQCMGFKHSLDRARKISKGNEIRRNECRAC